MLPRSIDKKTEGQSIRNRATSYKFPSSA